ncbi:reverse transcriptase domain-containing protein [Tanacetum coccineum]
MNRYGYSSVGRFDVFFRNQLLVFQQNQDESLYDSWTRFKDIIRKVPNHGLSIWTLIEIFLKHLDSLSRHIINLTTERDLRKFSDIGACACALVLLLISLVILLLIQPLQTRNVVTVDVQIKKCRVPFALEEDHAVSYDGRSKYHLDGIARATHTEGYAEAIVVPPILAEHFELKHSLINMMTSDQFFGLEKDNPHDHIRWFNKITSTIKYKDVPNHAIKLMLFPFSLAGAARRWLEKEPPRSITTWDDLVSKFINEFFPPSRTTNLRNEISNFQQKFDESFHEAWDRYKDLLRACPHHGFTELHQLDTFYNALNPADQDSLNSATGGNLLERPKLTHAVNQQTSVVTTAMTAILKQFQATPPPASVKAVEEICVTCGGAHPYYQCLAADGNTFRDNIQGYVSAAAVNYNQGNFGYRPPSVANQIRPPGFAQPNVQNNQNRFSQPQGYNRGNNFNQDTSYQAPTQQNQVVPLSELEKIKKMNEVNIKVMQAH